MTRQKLLVSQGQGLEVASLARRAARAGFHVITDTEGQVVELARQHRPHLIVLDVCQPKGDGLELLARLRLGPKTRDVPVVAVSDVHDDYTQSVALELGAVAYGTSPLSDEWLGSVQARLRDRRADLRNVG